MQSLHHGTFDVSPDPDKLPMFAPRVMGSILCTGSTPTPQSGVSVEVVLLNLLFKLSTVDPLHPSAKPN